ncbi:hypothetical protein PMIN01_09139 [Paraphaeosphaeria minitans]|uniref:Uncharacterized protein n=1 Tax=Paraphaeosphaeria minitans TaxID=565426 RepID=A0A9P6GE05_9PLEO|nr:hypothetical protein PMIN01_09139 [Paraphaeosphaeria minitans]
MSTPFLPCPQDPAHQRRPNLTRHRGIHLVARRPRTAPSSANNNDKRAGLGRSTNAEMQPWDPVECRTGDVYDAVSITGAARVLDGARGVRLCGRASRDCRSHWGAWGVRTGQTNKATGDTLGAGTKPFVQLEDMLRTFRKREGWSKVDLDCVAGKVGLRRLMCMDVPKAAKPPAPRRGCLFFPALAILALALDVT